MKVKQNTSMVKLCTLYGSEERSINMTMITDNPDHSRAVWDPEIQSQKSIAWRQPGGKARRNWRIYKALLESFAIWSQRYGNRGSTLLNQRQLEAQVLPQLMVAIDDVHFAEPVDLAVTLALHLSSCTNEECSSFAGFSPTLANYVALFEQEYRCLGQPISIP